jgi:hypothetical protein
MHTYIFIIWLQMGFSPVAVVQQVHDRQVTHITRNNNTTQSNSIYLDTKIEIHICEKWSLKNSSDAYLQFIISFIVN